jgi:hypothetical protein
VKGCGVKMVLAAVGAKWGEVEAEEGVEREEETVHRWEEEGGGEGRGEGGGDKELGVIGSPGSICWVSIPGLACFGGGDVWV